jgi:hypothetical protein
VHLVGCTIGTMLIGCNKLACKRQFERNIAFSVFRKGKIFLLLILIMGHSTLPEPHLQLHSVSKHPDL